MKRTMTMIFICAILATSAFAQADQQKPATAQPAAKPADVKPVEAMPSVDQILDKFVQAIGGKAAIEKVTSRVSKGTFEITAMGVSGPMEVYSKAPNKNYAIITIGGVGTVKQGYNGTIAWSDDPNTGMRELSGAELVAAKRQAEFYADLKFKEMYPKMTVTGKDKVGDKEVYVIEATPPEGGSQKLYFDTQTGLLLRNDRVMDTAMGKLPFEIYLEDYREVDGIKMPFLIRQVTSGNGFVVKVSEVKHNVPIEDTMFNKPATQ
jgi:zinc protease